MTYPAQFALLLYLSTTIAGTQLAQTMFSLLSVYTVDNFSLLTQSNKYLCCNNNGSNLYNKTWLTEKNGKDAG